MDYQVWRVGWNPWGSPKWSYSFWPLVVWYGKHPSISWLHEMLMFYHSATPYCKTMSCLEKYHQLSLGCEKNLIFSSTHGWEMRCGSKRGPRWSPWTDNMLVFFSMQSQTSVWKGMGEWSIVSWTSSLPPPPAPPQKIFQEVTISEILSSI